MTLPSQVLPQLAVKLLKGFGILGQKIGLKGSDNLIEKKFCRVGRQGQAAESLLGPGRMNPPQKGELFGIVVNTSTNHNFPPNAHTGPQANLGPAV
jgi:hypothetical protein